MKLLLPEEKIIRREANKKYIDSNKYRISDFPKRRCYVILAKSKKTGEILGYANISPKEQLSRNRVVAFTPYTYSFNKGLFDLHSFRACKNSGHANAVHAASLLRTRKGSENFEIFVARAGAKKCPVKVHVNPVYANRITKFKLKPVEHKDEKIT